MMYKILSFLRKQESHASYPVDSCLRRNDKEISLFALLAMTVILLLPACANKGRLLSPSQIANRQAKQAQKAQDATSDDPTKHNATNKDIEPQTPDNSFLPDNSGTPLNPVIAQPNDISVAPEGNSTSLGK